MLNRPMPKIFYTIKVVDSQGTVIDEVNWKLIPNESLLNATERFRDQCGKSYGLGARFIAQDKDVMVVD